MTTTTPPLVSIVILNFNHPEVIEICLKTLATTEGVSYEVVVVDNGSTYPGTLEFLRTERDAGRITKLVELPENLFFAGGNNIGVANTNPETEYILLVNSDYAFLKPNWLVKLLDWMNGTIEYKPAAWAFHTTQPSSGPRDIISVDYLNDLLERDGVAPDGACLLMRRKWWRDISLDFPWLYGDIEMVASAIRDGAKCGVLGRGSGYFFHRRHGSVRWAGEKDALDAKVATVAASKRQPDIQGWFEGLEVESLDFTPGPNERDSFLVW